MMFDKKTDAKDITKTVKINTLRKKIPITYPDDLNISINSLVGELNSILGENINELCNLSLQHAVDFIEYTGEALYLMLDTEDEEDEEIEELMEKWNDGNIEELADFLERWFSEKDAKKIAQKCKKTLRGKKISIEELLQLVAKTALALGLYKNNFGNIYLAVEKELKKDPKGILRFMYPKDIHVSIGADRQAKYLIYFENDWEPEHGINWVIEKGEPVSVGSD